VRVRGAGWIIGGEQRSIMALWRASAQLDSSREKAASGIISYAWQLEKKANFSSLAASIVSTAEI